MAELKTKATAASVAKFLKTLADAQVREDCNTIIQMMSKATRAEAKMWGSAIIGFGDYHYIYESGRELDWFVIGFSPRKQNITLYLTTAGSEKHEALLEKLGKHKTTKGCLYIKKLSDVDESILKKMIEATVAGVEKKKKQS
ncbi:MAG: DUF1801 domain-containing protein [Candidatus Kapaibacterium sp.]|jgi:hypothetical protein